MSQANNLQLQQHDAQKSQFEGATTLFGKLEPPCPGYVSDYLLLIEFASGSGIIKSCDAVGRTMLVHE